MNYGTMKALFKKLLNRRDLDDTLVPTFFQQSWARAMRELRLPHMERIMDVDTSVSAVDTVIIPADWLETIDFVTDDGELTFLDIGPFLRRRTLSTEPQWYTRKFDRWIVKPAFPKGSNASLLFYAEEAFPTADDEEPTLAAIAADLVIYGALTYAADFFVDDRGPGWEQKWATFKQQLLDQAADSENRNGTNHVEPAYTFDDGA
jgi:hypothetical protein